MTLALYRGVTTAAGPLARLLIDHRIRHGKEEPERVGERFGHASARRLDGPLTWIHAASVGEALSVISLVKHLVSDWPNLNILFTTGTVTSARLLRDLLPANVAHQYVPLDRLAWVRRFLDHWRPDLVLWVESELWPNALCEIGARGVPLVLINARISEKSFHSWQRVPQLIRKLLANFDLCLAQSDTDAERLRALGAPRTEMPGNLKFASPPLSVDETELERTRRAVSGRTVWLASSTHPGEETQILTADRLMRAAFPGLLTVIAPRHPGRGKEIADMLRSDGAAVAQRSHGETVSKSTEVYLADTMGELGLLYRLAPVTFIGGSLIPHGGQNLLEPAQLDCAIVHGPSMFNFQSIVEEMAMADAIAETNTPDAIALEVEHLLSDPGLRAQRTAAARRIAESKRHILETIVGELTPFLDSLAAGDKKDHAHA